MQNILKYAIGLITVIALRLIPHPPNVEPIMSTMMPFSKRWGWLSGMIFGLVAILSYDLLTGTLGTWSFSTAGTYAFIGVLSGLYLKNKESSILHYVGFAVFATLLYDAITGIAFGVLVYHMSFMETFLGQIPFTLYHLGGNIALSVVVSPLLYRWVVTNPKLETSYISSQLALVFSKSS
jgi:ABC-type branched-subunit amino acid transport system permease subunit